MIRAPDSYVYPAPFNLIEAGFVAPLDGKIKRETLREAQPLCDELHLLHSLGLHRVL